MSPEVATAVYAVGICGLFILDRDTSLRASKALWIPVGWLLVVGTRPVSQWLNVTPPNPLELYLDGSPLDRDVFAVLLVAGLIVLFARSRRTATLLRLNWPIVVFFGYCAVSTLWSDYPDVAFRRWIKALGDLVMVLIVLTDADPAAALKRLLARAGFVALPASVLLIKYYPDLGRTYSPDFGHWHQMYTGVATGKNGLGGLTLVLGLGALWQLLQLLQNRDLPHRRRRLLAQAVLLATVSWIFSVTDSMTSLVCFVLGAGLIVITSISARFRRPAILNLFVMAALSASSFATFFAPDLLSMIGRNPTLTGRTEIWRWVLSMPVNRLIGTGFESFWLGDRLLTMWNLYWWHPNEAHNGYIEVLLNLGWIGLVLLIVLLVAGYRHILSAFRHEPAISSLKLAYLLAGLIYAVTEAAFRMAGLTWIFLILATTDVPSAPDTIDSASPVVEHDSSLAEPQLELHYATHAHWNRSVS